MRSRLVLFVAAALLAAGCDKRGTIEIKSETLSDEYRDNPATADTKYKGVTIRTQAFTNMEKQNGDTVCVYERPGGEHNHKQPPVVFHFRSEAEAAKMEKGKWYTVEGHLDGLIDGKIHVQRVTVLGSYPLK